MVLVLPFPPQTTGMGPLLLACMFCNLELVQLLLDRKAAPDITWGGPQVGAG